MHFITSDEQFVTNYGYSSPDRVEIEFRLSGADTNAGVVGWEAIAWVIARHCLAASFLRRGVRPAGIRTEADMRAGDGAGGDFCGPGGWRERDLPAGGSA